jgi:hypothetical protein
VNLLPLAGSSLLDLGAGVTTDASEDMVLVVQVGTGGNPWSAPDHDGRDALRAPLPSFEALSRSRYPTPIPGSRVKAQIHGFRSGGAIGVASLLRPLFGDAWCAGESAWRLASYWCRSR